MPNLQRLNTADTDFWARLERLTSWEGVADEAVTTAVRDILAQVRARDDAALLEYTQRFDRMAVAQAADLEIPQARREGRRWKPPPPGFAPMPSGRTCHPGALPRPMARCWVSRSRR